LGATGVGKSSLANSLCGHLDLFKTSPDVKSETTDVTGVLVQMKKHGILGTKYNVLVLDTPGQGDSEGRD
jgi:predicted GTPase